MYGLDLHHSKSLVVLAFVILIAACGGGGGSGSSGSNPPPPAASPPPPPPRLSLALGQLNALKAASIAVSLTEDALQIGSLAKSMVLEIAAAETIALSRSCRNGGIVEWDLTDNDGDMGPSPGDILRVTFRDCETLHLNTAASGDLLITMTTPSPAPMAGETVISGSIDATALTIFSPIGLPDTISMGGTPAFSYRQDLLQTTLSVSGDATFSISDGGTTVTETLSGFEFRKHQSFEEARYQIDASGLFDSEELGGTFEFDDTLNISGYLATYPEQGRLELIGRDESRVLMLPIDVEGLPNSNLLVQVDPTGSGTFEAVERPSWSEVTEGFLWWFEDADDFTYSAQTFSTTSVNIQLYAPKFGDTARADTGMRIQYSRRIDPTSIPAELFACVSGNEMQFDSFCVPLDIDLRGALLLLTPREQLPQNYRVDYPFPGFDALDELGNRTFTFNERFETTESVFAVAAVSNISVIAGDTVSLDASQSSVTKGSITSYQWSQVSGPTISINDANSASASFVVPAIDEVEEIVLSLEVTSSEGIRDYETIKMGAFASQLYIQFLYFTGDGGDWVSQGDDWLLTSMTGGLLIERNFDKGVSFTHTLNLPDDQVWRLQFAAANNEKIGVGVYENAVRFPFQDADQHGLDLSGDGRGCNTLIGRFEVLEISYNAFDDAVTAAIDFEQYCEGGSSRAFGSVRVGSSIPVN